LLQFACFQPACPRRFGAPKTRRLHLVDAHGYPPDYFFAVTNKGIGALVASGGSLIRTGHGKPKGNNNAAKEKDKRADKKDAQDVPPHMSAQGRTEHKPEPASAMQLDPTPAPESASAVPSTLADNTTDGGAPPHARQPRPASHRGRPHPRPHLPPRTPAPKPDAEPPGTMQLDPAPDDVDALASSLDALALVPRAVRFGRGGLHTGFAPRARGRGRGRGTSQGVSGEA
jgi:hypothetical protein